MTSVQNVLTDNGKLKARVRRACEPQVQLSVRWEALIRDLRPVAEHGIKRKVERQVQRGSQSELMSGIVGFAAPSGCVGAARFRSEVYVKFCVAGVEPPAV
jgi:hypothetical protein